MNRQNNINEYIKTPFLDGVELLNAQNCTVSFPLHKHETYNISLIINNTFKTDLINHSFIAPTGSIAITNANELHATPCDADIGNTFLTFYVPPTVVQHLKGCSTVAFNERVIYDKKLFNDFLWFANKENIAKKQFECKLTETLTSLLKQSDAGKIENNTDKSLKLFINDIISNEEESFSLTNIASKYGINKYKFIRLFKQATGVTPKHFMLLKRIEKSKNLLKKGHPIYDVAIACGFYDCPHFYKYFKLYTGVNPLVFQAAFQKD